MSVISTNLKRTMADFSHSLRVFCFRGVQGNDVETNFAFNEPFMTCDKTTYENLFVIFRLVDLKEKLDGEGDLINELMDSMNEIRKISESPTKVEIVRPNKGRAIVYDQKLKHISSHLHNMLCVN